MEDEEFVDDQSFESFRPALMLLARSQLGLRFRRVLDDSDIVQQSLLEAHNNRSGFRGTSSAECFAWLRKILTNTILDHVRRYTREKRNVELEVSLEQTIRGSALRAEQWLMDRHSSPGERAERNEQLRQLAVALMKLPEAQREAIELFHLQGCELKDVARRMNRTGPAVAGLIHRGLRQLRTTIPTERSLSTLEIIASQDEEASEATP
jgi:RNA polymerase sigma-70 factor (ECF subfamily)